MLTDFELMMTQLFFHVDVQTYKTFKYIANKKTIISSNGEEILSSVLFIVDEVFVFLSLSLGKPPKKKQEKKFTTVVNYLQKWRTPPPPISQQI